MRLAGLFAFFACTLQGAFTLEQVLGSAFPSELIASPRGGRIAWLSDQRGVRNVFVAEAPSYQPKQVTGFQEDDGQELSGLAFSADGSALVFVRGGGPNGRGENPNPLSRVDGVAEEVYAISGSGAPKLIAKGGSPALSPDGKTVAFVVSGQIWTGPSDGSVKPVQLIHARGTAGLLRWSPDGKRLAFVSGRTDHSFIALYDFTAKSLAYLDPGVDRDEAPVFSPGGDKLAWVRVPASMYAFMFGPKRTAEPWSIRVTDFASGKTREVWKAKPGPGSEFHPLPAANPILWGARDRLVFPYERTGWAHLYSTSATDGGETELTPGNFEVEHFTLTPDGNSAVFASNQDDIDRRHLWRVPVGGGAVSAVLRSTKLEWEPAVTSDGRIAYLTSDEHVAAHPAILGGGREQALASMPDDFPAGQLVKPEQVIFPAADGMAIHGQLFLPPSRQDGKRHPAVIFFHGGSRRQMLLGWHYMFYYHQAYGFNEYLASKGYVVLSVNYRSGTGYGLNFREAEHYGATGASEFQDVIGAGLYLRGRGDVDPRHIGLWGGSYGGYLTALGLARASDLFAVGVDLHGVHEWNDEIQNFVPAYLPEKRQADARVAFESSPLAYMETWKSPVLLIHGDDDRNVNFRQSVMLAEALRKQGVYFEQLIFPDEIHDLLVHAHWLRAYHAADEFLARYLMK